VLLSEARTQVIQMLDDPDNVRFSQSEVDTALRVALMTCVSKASSCSSLVDSVVSITPSSGVASLSAHAPIKIKNVSMVIGSLAVAVNRVGDSAVHQTAEVNTPVTVRLVKTPTFPASAGTAFSYGNSISDNPTIDMLIVAEAALALIIKDREQPAVLVNQIASLYDTLQNYQQTVRSYKLGDNTTIEMPYGYTVTGYDLTLKWLAR
jgi:hypothetical protein